MNDAEVDEQTAELAFEAVCAVERYAAKYEALTGNRVPTSRMLGIMLNAAEERRHPKRDDGIASLGDARLERGLTAVAEPMAILENEYVMTLNPLTLDGATGKRAAALSLKVHGSTENPDLIKIIQAAILRGLNSLERDVGGLP